jgi:archaemetzincin
MSIMRITGIVVTLFFLIQASLYPEGDPIIAVQPLGHVDKKTVALIKNGILRAYNAEVVILKEKPLPSRAYYKPRRRYRADKLLRYLEEITPGKYTKVIGITRRDISTTKGKFYDWGIFGLGSVGGKSCVVSTFRLRRGKGGRRKFARRLVKVVNHELGHTFGLGHCPVKNCLMQDARGTIVTVDNETGEFCPQCREMLKGVVRGSESN